MGVGVALGPLPGDAEHLLRVVAPDLVIRDDGHPYAPGDRLLVPGLPHAVAGDGARLQGGGHLGRRCHRQQHVRLALARVVPELGRIETGVQAACRQPVPQLVVVGGDGEDHPHVEGLAPLAILRHHGLEGGGAHRGRHLARLRPGQLGRHGGPDAVGHRDGVAVEIHGKRRHQLGLGADADVGRQGLARQHLGTVQLAVYHPIQQDLPVRLGFEGDVESLILEIAPLVGHRQRRHVGQLDEAEPELLLLRGSQCQHRQRQRRQQQPRTSLSSVHCISSLGSGSGPWRQAAWNRSATSLQRCDPRCVATKKKPRRSGIGGASLPCCG